MTAYFRFVVRHRLAVFLACVALTALSLASISRAVIATSVGELFLGESPAYKEYVNRVQSFGNDEILIVGFEAPDLLQPGWQARLRAALERIEALPAVDRVESALSAQHIELEGDMLRVRRYAEEAEEEPARIPELLSAMREDPLAGGLVVSPSGRETAVLVELASDPTRPVEEGPRIVEEVLRIFEQEGFRRPQLHRAGLLAILAETMVQTNRNIKAIFPFVAAILLATVWILFRRLWPAVISLMVASLAVLWTTGIAVLLDRRIDVLMSMCPALILIVSFSDVVHLCSAYLIELGKGFSKEKAILRSAEDVGRACFYTSVTTLVGFLCFSLVPAPIFRKMGVVLGVGVATALLLAMTLAPAIFSVMKEPAPLRRGPTSYVQDGVDRLLKAMQGLATLRPWGVIVCFGALVAFSLTGLWRLNVETDFLRRFEMSNPLRKDQVWFEKHFAGTDTLDVYVEAPEADGLMDSERFGLIAGLQEELEELPTVDRALSLVDLVEEIHRKLNADEQNLDPLPTSRQAIAQYLLLFEMGGGEELERFVDFERRTMRIVLRLTGGGFRMASETGSNARSIARELLDGSGKAEPTGLLFLLGDWLDELLRGQRNGLLVSLLTVSVMMMVALRSVRVGLWAMVPNMLPLLALGGYVGGLWEQVDSDTLMIAYVAIGIGVDDTVHFLVRYRIEQARSPDTATAIRTTFDFSGRAIVMTTVILVAGFLPFVTSDYFTTHMFGTLLPLCLVVALLADLLLVPALVNKGLIRFRK